MAAQPIGKLRFTSAKYMVIAKTPGNRKAKHQMLGFRRLVYPTHLYEKAPTGS